MEKRVTPQKILQLTDRTGSLTDMAPTLFKKAKGLPKQPKNNEDDLSQQLFEVAQLASALREESPLPTSVTIAETELVVGSLNVEEGDEVDGGELGESTDEPAGELVHEDGAGNGEVVTANVDEEQIDEERPVTCKDLLDSMLQCFCSSNNEETEPLLPIHNQRRGLPLSKIVLKIIWKYILTPSVRRYILANQTILVVLAIAIVVIIIVGIATGSLSGLLKIIQSIICYNSDSPYCFAL